MIQPQLQTSAFDFPQKPHSSCASLWRDLYLRAIFEKDRAKVPERIQQAARALIHREHELCTEQNGVERESVITALHCLQALHGSMELESRKRIR